MMRCHVCLPDSRVLEIEVDQKATGQQCLDKVCENLSVLEDDYLGLRYSGNKQELLWLNLRNRVDQQVSGHQPYRFHLRIKFCVQPHSIQQDTTRHLYYQQVWQDLKGGQLSFRGNEDKLPKIVALVAQAEYGDQTANVFQMDIYEQLMQALCQSTNQNVLEAIKQEHQALQFVQKHAAEYRLLQEVAQLPAFGFEFHDVRSAHGDKIMFGVGPEGLLLKNLTENTTEHLAYPSIHMATHREREIYLQLLEDTGDLLPAVGYKLVSRKAAVALYRCITEMHSFYRCDTVSCDVSNQFCRDLKGTLVSIFNENSDLGKRYIFDIKRTSREAYDHARRKLYSLSRSTQSLATSQYHGSMQSMDLDHDSHDSHDSHDNSLDCTSRQCQHMKETLENIQESLMCCICMACLVGTVLCPCGHMTCSNCAHKIDECPFCRTTVERRQKVFMPNFAAQKLSEEEEDVEECAGEVV